MSTNLAKLTPIETRAWESLLYLQSSIFREMDRRLTEEHGLPLRWYDVLATLDEVPERQLRMNELAANVVLSASRLTRLVQRLQAEGLVERRPDQRDARAYFVLLTGAGRHRLEDARKTHHAIARSLLLERLSDGELDDLARLLRKALEGSRYMALLEEHVRAAEE